MEGHSSAAACQEVLAVSGDDVLPPEDSFVEEVAGEQMGFHIPTAWVGCMALVLVGSEDADDDSRMARNLEQLAGGPSAGCSQPAAGTGIGSEALGDS